MYRVYCKYFLVHATLCSLEFIDLFVLKLIKVIRIEYLINYYFLFYIFTVDLAVLDLFLLIIVHSKIDYLCFSRSTNLIHII